MEHDILFGLWIVGLAAVACGQGYGMRTQAGMLKLQAEMLKALGELTGIIAHGGMQAVQMNNWRELPPDAQLMMRNSLIQIIREMDGEMPSRH